MDSLLDFEECVKDSPEFRLKLELFEADVNVLETHLDKVMKLCGKMVEAGQVYNAANQLFLSGVAELSMFHQKDSVINLLDTRREFLRIGGDLDSAALKNSQVSRHRATDAERASHLLLATR
ncbi:Arf-GAP with coiled-coil ANK repeat and PH domain containing protein 3, partial [Dissostichus eleginoides]